MVRLPDDLDEVLSLQLEAAAVQGLAAVTGDGAIGPGRLDTLTVPVRARSGMVAHAHDAHVGPFRQFLGGAVGIPALELHLYVSAFDLGLGGSVGIPALELHLDVSAFDLGLDAVERAHAVGRQGAVPVLEDLFGAVAENGDLLDLGLVQRQQLAFVLEEDDGLLRHQAGLVLEFLALPGNIFSLMTSSER